jgi:hypothetical protein
MPDPIRNRLPARRGVLLIAVLLLAGLGPSAPVHQDGSGEARIALANGDGGEPDGPRQHDPEHCATCHLGTTSALPEPAGTRLPRPSEGATPGTDPPAPVLRALLLHTTARAPPVS